MEKKYYIITFLTALFLSLMLCACAGSNIDNDTPEEEKTAMVTRSLIIEKFNITESDLNDIDIELILEYNPYTEKQFNSIKDKQQMLQSLRYRQEVALEKFETEKWLAENSLSYLLEGSICQDALPSTGTLKWLILESDRINTRGGDDNSPTGFNAAVIDVENGIVYYGFYNNRMSVDHRQADEIYELNDTEMQSILNAFTAANVEEWISCDKENAAWHLGLEFDDGTVYTYEAALLEGKTYDFAQTIFSYSAMCENYLPHIYWDDTRLYNMN